MEISISEVVSYLRCRRKWDLSSPNRQGLRKLAVPKPSLGLGSALHAMLAAQAHGQDPVAAAQEWGEQETTAYAEAYLAAVGCGPSAFEYAEIAEVVRQAILLHGRYLDRYGEEPLAPVEYLRNPALGEQPIVEQPFRVQIPGTDGHLVGVFDALAYDPGTDSRWIVERKTYKRRPDYETLLTNHQFTAYAWAAGALLGTPVAGIFYDGICSTLPTPPARLKSGELSRAQTTLAVTDHATYLGAIDLFGLDAADYAVELDHLERRDAEPQTPFWTRWKLPLTAGQVASFASYLPAIYREMADPELPIYPDYRWDGCRDCGVPDLCRAIQHGDDIAYLVRTGYVRNEGSGGLRSRGGELVAVAAGDFAREGA